MIDDPDRCYLAASSRDPRFDGWFFVAVTSTGIYCRPSCPARTPKRANVRFFATAAAAQAAGFRSCKRCRPDAAPGSPEWNVRGDTVGRAMRLIADGMVDREGVTGLAGRLGYSARHLDRLLVAELGAGPLALARAQRAQTARVLIETTDLPFTDVAFGAGFGSLRQFNDTVRAVFATTPTALRRARRETAQPREPGAVTLRLARREPFAGADLLAFLGTRTVPGVEELDGSTYGRTLDLPGGPGTMRLTDTATHVEATLRLSDLRDLQQAASGARRLLDLDADPTAIDEHLDRDADLGALVRKVPGRRVPGVVAGHELATRAVVGQQVSVAGARTVAGQLVRELGRALPEPVGSLTHLFPTAEALAAADPERFPMPRARGRALAGLNAAIAGGEVELDPGADRDRTRAQLLARPGIGPWTADYLVIRTLGHPDVFLATDLGVRHALRALGRPDADGAEWAPWRSYATLHLWSTLS